jgi:hypothetical protein
VILHNLLHEIEKNSALAVATLGWLRHEPTMAWLKKAKANGSTSLALGWLKLASHHNTM